MPFTTFLLLAFAMGFAVALAGASELRRSPRHALMTASFGALLAYVGLVFVPVSAYFYVFHGDWFMLYLVDVRRIPSALALIGFVLEALLSVLGFLVAASLVRGQRNDLVGVATGACVVLSGSVVLVCPDRLLAVGTYGQYRGGFGLAPYGGALLQGTVAMLLLLALGALYLLYRIRRSGVR